MDPNELFYSVRFATKFFKNFNNLRGRFGLDVEELMIFFGLGRLNFDPSQEHMMPVKPVNILSLSDFLIIPRETLRRKLLRLEEKGLVTRTSYGYVVKDLASWRRLADVATSAETEA